MKSSNNLNFQGLKKREKERERERKERATLTGETTGDRSQRQWRSQKKNMVGHKSGHGFNRQTGISLSALDQAHIKLPSILWCPNIVAMSVDTDIFD